MEVKRSEIGQKVKASMKQSGRNPALFKRIIITAIYALGPLINRILKNAKTEADKAVDTVTEAKSERKDYREVFNKEPAKEAVPEIPVKSVLASKFHRLTDIYHKLEKQNEAIYEREQQFGSLEKELANAKGIFKGKQRKELQEQIEQLQMQIENMKRYLPSIVQGYGYKNVKEFLTEYKASKAEYNDYKLAVAKWEQQTGNKAESDSIKARLQRKQQEVKEHENNRQSHRIRDDRGGR